MYVRIKQCVHGYKIYKGPIFFSLKYFRERKVTHTFILEYFDIEEYALSDIAFQS